MTSTRPTWAEVSRSRLVHNHDLLRRLAGAHTELLCVVKANAYGHGLEECAQALEANGARWFGVTSVEEGLELRRVLPEARSPDSKILVMCGIWEGEAEATLEHDLTPVVWDPRHIDLLEDAARRLRAAPGDCPVHVEIDTGMSRQGVQPKDLASLLGRFGPDSALRIEAVMTHFHSPGNAEMSAGQVREFVTAVETIVASGQRPEILSAGSSADALEHGREAIREAAQGIGAKTMLRPGLALYGYAPDGGEGARQLQPVLAWKTRVISLREIPAGATVGYDATFRTTRPTRVALLPVGYADGLNRLLSGDNPKPGEVLVHGQRAPVAGRISMDHTSVDVTDVAGVEVGDEVVLIGTQNAEQGEEKVTAADMAKLTGTISYEVLCGIAPRVPRRMVE
jgi:alanine racemase